MNSSGQSSCSSYATHVPMYFFNNNNTNGPPKPPARKRRPKSMFCVSKNMMKIRMFLEYNAISKIFLIFKDIFVYILNIIYYKYCTLYSHKFAIK